MDISFHQSIIDTLCKNIHDVTMGVIIKDVDKTQQFSLKENPLLMKQLFKDPEHIVITYPLEDEDNKYIVVTTYVKGYKPSCSFIDIYKKQVIHTTLHRDTFISFLTSEEVSLN